jgi:hypothetical protein
LMIPRPIPYPRMEPERAYDVYGRITRMLMALYRIGGHK